MDNDHSIRATDQAVYRYWIRSKSLRRIKTNRAACDPQRSFFALQSSHFQPVPFLRTEQFVVSRNQYTCSPLQVHTLHFGRVDCIMPTLVKILFSLLTCSRSWPRSSNTPKISFKCNGRWSDPNDVSWTIWLYIAGAAAADITRSVLSVCRWWSGMGMFDLLRAVEPVKSY